MGRAAQCVHEPTDRIYMFMVTLVKLSGHTWRQQVKKIPSWTQCKRVRGGGLSVCLARPAAAPPAPALARRAFPEISRVEPIFQLKRGESF